MSWRFRSRERHDFGYGQRLKRKLWGCSIFSTQKRRKGIRHTYKKLEQFLASHDLIDQDGKVLLPANRVDAFLPEIDKRDSPVHFYFKQTFRLVDNKQQTYLKEVVNTQFSPTSTEKFFTNYQQIMDTEYPLPSFPLFFLSYWKKVMEALKNEIQPRENPTDHNLRDAFFLRFELETKAHFRQLTHPNG